MKKHRLTLERNTDYISRINNADYISGICECGDWSKISIIKGGSGSVNKARGDLNEWFQIHAWENRWENR